MSEVFVGRTDELERFRTLLHDLGARHPGRDEGHAMLVHGHGGIGKSTLLRQFRAVAGRWSRWGLPGLGRPRLVVVFIDWQDSEPAGNRPELTRVLNRLRRELADRLPPRRVARALRSFERRVQLLSDLDEAAQRLGLGPALGHRPAGEVAGRVVAGASGAALAVAGVPNAGEAARAVTDAVTELVPRRVPWYRDRLEMLLDEERAVLHAFAAGVRDLSRLRRRRLLFLLDTCELLGPASDWLREVIVRAGPRTGWVLGLRMEGEADSGLVDNEFERYRRHLGQGLRIVSPARFDDRTTQEYVHQKLGSWPDGLELDRLARVTRGIPLAVALVTGALARGVPPGQVLSDAPVGDAAQVVRDLATRYLVHVREVPGAELELQRLYGLALYYEPATDYRWAVSQRAARRLEPGAGAAASALDADLLAGVWQVALGQLAATLDELGRRHDFVLRGPQRMHQDVRETIRRFLLDPVQRAQVRELNARAARLLRDRLAGLDLADLLAGPADPGREDSLARLLWHEYWVDGPQGTRRLCQLVPPARLAGRSGMLRQLIQVARFFEPTLTGPDRELVGYLVAIDATPFYRRTGPRLAPEELGRRMLARAPDLAPFRAAVPPEFLVELFVAAISPDESWPVAVAATERAAGRLPPDSGRWAEVLARRAIALAGQRFDGDPNHPLPAAQRERVAQLAVRARPALPDSWEALGYACHLAGDDSGASEAYQQAMECPREDPVAGLTRLVRRLGRLGRPADAAAAYRLVAGMLPAGEPGRRSRRELGRSLHQAGETGLARVEWQAVLAGTPDDPLALRGLADGYRQGGDLPAALRCYRRLAELQRDPREAWQALLDTLAVLDTPALLKTQAGAGPVTDGLAQVRARIGAEPDPDQRHRFRRWLADWLLAAGDFPAARAELQAILDEQPDDASTCNSVGVTYDREGDLAAAEQWCARAAELDPDPAVYWTNRSLLLGRLDRRPEAVRLLRDRLAVEPDADRCRVLRRSLAERLVDAGELEPARAELRLLLAGAPEDAEAQHALGRIEALAGDHEAASHHYQRAAELAPDQARFWDDLGAALARAGRHPDVIALLRSRVAEERDPARHRQLRQALAGQLLLAGAPEEARVELRRLVAEAPYDAAVRFDLGLASLRVGDPEAAAEFRTAVRLAPRTVRYHRVLAETLTQLGRPGEAKAGLAAALACWPGEAADALAARADLLHDLGRHAESAATCQVLTGRNLPDGAAHRALGDALTHLGEFDRAVEALDVALARWPQDPDAYRLLGSCYAQQQRLADAERCLRRAIALNPFDAWALAMLARLRVGSDPAETRELAGRALAGPAAPNAAALALAARGAAQLVGGGPDTQDAAVRDLRAAIEWSPYSADAQLLLGTLLADEDDPAPAIEALVRGLELAAAQLAEVSEPVRQLELVRCRGARWILAHLLLWRGDYPAAAGEFRTVLAPEQPRDGELVPITDAHGYTDLAEALWGAGDPAAALTAARRAVELAPDRLTPHVLLGGLLRGPGPAEARAAFTRALAAPPPDDESDDDESAADAALLRAVALAGLDRTDDAVAELTGLAGLPDPPERRRPYLLKALADPPVSGLARIRERWPFPDPDS